MTWCVGRVAACALLCCLLAVTIGNADKRATSAYNPAPGYAAPHPSAHGAYGPPYGPPRQAGSYGASSAQPNQRFILGPIKGIIDKLNPFNKGSYGQYGGYPSPFGGVFPNPFAGLCNPAYTGQTGGYKPPLPPGYNPPQAPGYAPPSSDAAYIPPHSSGNRPIVIYTRPSHKSPTYSRPSDDRPNYDVPDHKKHMITSRPHPLYG